MPRPGTRVFAAAALAALVMGGCGVVQPKLAMPRLEMPKLQLFPHKNKTPPPQVALFRTVEQLTPDGTLVPLADEQRTPFQVLLRDRIPPGAAVDSIVALEVDLPEEEGGQGGEGSYLAILRGPRYAELRYYEQKDHHPRLDRYYHRTLTVEELGTLDALGQEHTFDDFRPPDPADAPTEGFRFRITIARQADTKTVELPIPSADDPAGQLIGALRRLRDGAELSCVYFQPIPPTAQMLFAEPFRHVDAVWARGDDVRAYMYDTTPGKDEPASSAWFARKPQGWVPSEAPPEDAGDRVQIIVRRPENPSPPPIRGTTAGALVPHDVGQEADEAGTPALAVPSHATASQPALVKAPPPPPPAPEPAAKPAEPSPFSIPDLLPHEEYWWTQVSGYSTVVWHYVPVSAAISHKVGFTVPGLVFDDDHMAIDSIGGWLYLIHDGVLFRIPIPDTALTQF